MTFYAISRSYIPLLRFSPSSKLRTLFITRTNPLNIHIPETLITGEKKLITTQDLLAARKQQNDWLICHNLDQSLDIARLFLHAPAYSDMPKMEYYPNSTILIDPITKSKYLLAGGIVYYQTPVVFQFRDADLEKHDYTPDKETEKQHTANISSIVNYPNLDSVKAKKDLNESIVQLNNPMQVIMQTIPEDAEPQEAFYFDVEGEVFMSKLFKQPLANYISSRLRSRYF